VFAFASDNELELRGRQLLDCLTACYAAYRARVEEAARLMPCTCGACGSISGLELKFVLHHGEFVVRWVAGHLELLGPDVTVSHLLLKNHVAELIGRRGYALVTERAAERLEVPLDDALPIIEQYDHYEPVLANVFTLS